MRTEIIIRATKTQQVLGEKGRRIRELTSVVQKRFPQFSDGAHPVELYAGTIHIYIYMYIYNLYLSLYTYLLKFYICKYLHSIFNRYFIFDNDFFY